LLDKGSTQLIRNTAAQQLADVQKQNPDNVFALLGRVLPYLQSKSWDTRTAAAKAIGGIIENNDKFDPNADEAKSESVQDEEDGAIKTEDKAANGDEMLHLSSLDISLILNHGKKLLGSAGKEYEYSMAGMTAAQRLAYQKQSLTSRLGLGGEYMDDELVNEQDFAAGSQHRTAPTPGPMKIDTKANLQRDDSLRSASPTSSKSPLNTNGHASIDESGLSKRQLNQLKRKNKSAAKSGSSKMRVVDLSNRRTSELAQTPTSATPHPVKLNGHDESNGDAKPDYFSIKREGSDDETALVSEFKGEEVPEKPLIQPDGDDAHDWPFEIMCEFLANDLFDPTWEIRHGAAMGLREVLRVHGKGAGRRYGKIRSENDAANERWLNDMACRLLCVLMLDRFG
jgi:TATA-binding protein-associated factor